MTAKDKAIELVEIFGTALALIAVDEILKSNPSYEDYGGDGWILIDNSAYWNEVKQEIIKL